MQNISQNFLAALTLVECGVSIGFGTKRTCRFYCLNTIRNATRILHPFAQRTSTISLCKLQRYSDSIAHRIFPLNLHGIFLVVISYVIRLGRLGVSLVFSCYQEVYRVEFSPKLLLLSF